MWETRELLYVECKLELTASLDNWWESNFLEITKQMKRTKKLVFSAMEAECNLTAICKATSSDLSVYGI